MLDFQTHDTTATPREHDSAEHPDSLTRVLYLCGNHPRKAGDYRKILFSTLNNRRDQMNVILWGLNIKMYEGVRQDLVNG